MPMSHDPAGGGAEINGDTNSEYCSLCYHIGEFVNPTMTLDEMTSLVDTIMHSMNVPEEVISATKAKLPTLKRWRQPVSV